MLDQPLTIARCSPRRTAPIGRLIFNNPARHNAVSLEMWQGIAQIMAEFDSDDAIRVIVVTGRGRQGLCLRRRHLGVQGAPQQRGKRPPIRPDIRGHGRKSAAERR